MLARAVARVARVAGVAGVLALAPAARGELRLSEFMAAADDRRLAEDGQGRWRPGSGPHWTDPGFAGVGWRRGAAPLGFGGPGGLGTDVGALMRNRTPSLYVRQRFDLTAAEAANLGRLHLRVRFDDGFVAWINGREAGRANAGPAGHFLYHDMPAYNFAAPVDDPRYEPRAQPGVGGEQPVTLDLGPAGAWVREGENVLALQLLNREPDGAARLDATLADPDTARTLVPWSAAGWDYWPGLAEPSGGLVEPADFEAPAAEPGFDDWIEIENTGAEAVSLAGWALTTRRDDPRQWSFPATASVPAGGRLVVLAGGRPAPPPGAAWLHANFTLPADGSYLALVDPSGAVRDEFDPAYAPQGPLHSYGRNAAGVWGFLREASPGRPNTGPWAAAETAPVTISPAGGFHSGPVTVTLATPTPGARIRYTLDGTEPTATHGFAYAEPLVLFPINDKTGHPVRARAFLDGQVPSAVTTQSYLIDQHPGLRSAPALVLTGDPGATFYRPAGILAVQGGTYIDELWVPLQASDYHLPLAHGRMLDAQAPQRPYERPAHLEFYPVDDRPPFSRPVGVRVASSPYSRPRLKLTQAATASPLPSHPTEKPSFNLFFRADSGDSPVSYPFLPETPVRRFEELRLRAGKNDIRNPFIRDEFIRRLFTDMGQTGSVGSFNGLWINGVYKGYYNLCERIREPFLQNHHPGSGEWDVDAIFQFEDGDSDHFDNFLVKRLLADLSTRENYEALGEVLDLANVADYYLLMVYAAMWDWPDNNWVMARERAPGGRWRCYVWDAEGCFGLNGYKPATWNTFTRDLFPANFWICVQFQRLMTSPEWRLLFADRIQRHFFNGGALTDGRLTARKDGAAAEVAPFLAHAGITPDHTWFTQWLDPATGRKRVLLPHLLPGQTGYSAGHFRDPDGDGDLGDSLWPLTLAPTLSLPPGSVPAGSTLALGLPPGVPPGSTIHLTLDGGDPRAWGGAVADGALASAGPVPLAASTVTVRARVRHAVTGEWSPLTEAVYRVGTVPAAAGNLVVSELMFHPPPPTAAEAAAGFTDPDDFEYVALRALGPAPVDLSSLRFTEGISFDFTGATPAVVDPGDHVLLARNRAAIARRYGETTASRVVGEYFGGLSNAGEPLRLESRTDGTPVQAFRYGDAAPWPAAADGGGSSLVLLAPDTHPDPAVPSHWAASAAFAGQPGGTALALTYDAWGAWVFPAAAWANPALAGPAADPDQDGWANLLEFALSGAPLDPARSPSVEWKHTTGPDGDRLEISVRVSPGAAGVTFTPEGTASLEEGAWQRDFIAAPETPQPDGSVRHSWHRPLPPGTRAWFGRLRAAPAGL